MWYSRGCQQDTMVDAASGDHILLGGWCSAYYVQPQLPVACAPARACDHAGRLGGDATHASAQDTGSTTRLVHALLDTCAAASCSAIGCSQGRPAQSPGPAF